MFFQSGTFTNREKWMRHLSINPPMIEAQECQHPGRNLVAFRVRNKNAWKCPLVPNHILAGNGLRMTCWSVILQVSSFSGQQTIKLMANARKIQRPLIYDYDSFLLQRPVWKHEFDMFHSSTKGAAERFRNSIFSAAINPDAISLFVVSCLIQKTATPSACEACRRRKHVLHQYKKRTEDFEHCNRPKQVEMAGVWGNHQQHTCNTRFSVDWSVKVCQRNWSPDHFCEN